MSLSDSLFLLCALCGIAASIASFPGIVAWFKRAEYGDKWKRYLKFTAVSLAFSFAFVVAATMMQTPAERQAEQAREAQQAAAEQASADADARRKTAAAAAQQKADADQAKKNQTVARQQAQQWWADVMAPASAAFFALQNPVALGAKDAADLSAIVKKAGEMADQAKSAAAGGAQDSIPDGWNDVEDSLILASDDLRDGCQSLRDYIDTEAPSKAADAKEKSESSRALFADALEKARAHYIQMGGKPEQLRDYDIPKP